MESVSHASQNRSHGLPARQPRRSIALGRSAAEASRQQACRASVQISSRRTRGIPRSWCIRYRRAIGPNGEDDDRKRCRCKRIRSNRDARCSCDRTVASVGLGRRCNRFMGRVVMVLPTVPGIKQTSRASIFGHQAIDRGGKVAMAVQMPMIACLRCVLAVRARLARWVEGERRQDEQPSDHGRRAGKSKRLERDSLFELR